MAAVLAGLMWPSPTWGSDLSRHNVLFILVDDLGRHDLGYAGSTYYETPAIDQLAAESLSFNCGYAASRVCSPSRASIFTGQFTARHGVTDWIGARSGQDWRAVGRHDRLLPADYAHQMPREPVTLAEAFRASGYQTFYAGKWHLGGEGSSPEDHGFAINVGGYHAGGPQGGFFSPWKNPRLSNRQPGESLTMRLAEETAEFIRSHTRNTPDQPFLACLSFYAVHAPLQTTQQRWRKYRDKAAAEQPAPTGFEMQGRLPHRVVQDNPLYAGMVETVDDAVGLVRRTLEESRVADKTIVVFTSDHGGVCAGDAYATTNAPLRGGKGQPYEGGLRVPCLLRAPGVTDEGGETNEVTISADWYPTLAELCGIDMPEGQAVDGVSVAPALAGDPAPQRDLIWHYPHYGNQGGEPSSVIRRGQWKLIDYHATDRIELFDLSADTGEMQNLAQEFPQVTEALQQALSDYLQAVGASYAMIDPLHDAEKHAAYLRRQREQVLPSLEAQRRQVLSDDYSPGNGWWGSDTQPPR